MPSDVFPLDRFLDIKQFPEEFRLLERVPFTVRGFEKKLPYVFLEKEDGEETLPLLFLSLVTTGFNSTQDHIIELGLVKCTASRTRHCLLSIDRIFDGYEDPLQPLNEDLQCLGYSDALVKDKKIDDHVIVSFFADHPLVIAHGAYRQRPFFDRRFPMLSREAWGCSSKDINWADESFSSSSLEFVLQVMGYFYDKSRICDDGLALAFILQQYPQFLDQVLQRAFQLSYSIEVKGNNFEIKDQLKELGLFFNRNTKVTCGQFPAEEDVSRVLESLSTMPELNMRSVTVYSSSARERFRV